MYISIKLPAAFGSFNRLRKENYPFNSSFTEFLDAICTLGIAKGMEVGELVGWIEDRVFDGQRLPDVPEDESGGIVNIRYKIDNDKYPNIVKYISGGKDTTNRMAIMYVARMVLRMSVTYGTSLFRLKRVITDLMNEKPAKRAKTKEEEPVRTPTPKPRRVKEDAPEEEASAPGEEAVPVLPRVSSKGTSVQEETPEKEPGKETVKEPEKGPEPATASGVKESAEAAKAALAELEQLAADAPVVQTNPLLGEFY